MPLVGRLLADFSDFQSAVQKAEVSLRGMESGAGKVGGALNRMVDQFSGRKLIQDAALSAEAVERIGGTTKLTTSELQRLGVQANEALAKMKAMGVDVPPGIQKIADAAKNIKPQLDAATSSTSTFFSALKGAAGAVGIAFSIGAVTRFVGSVFDAASEINDMSLKLGVSAEATQRFKFAAEQTGTTLDTVGRAINFMNRTLSEGDKSTVGALKDAGLNFQAIRNMRPEDAFAAIAEAVARIENPMLQAEVATKLFSKAGADLLPGIKQGFIDIGNQANVMSDDTVKSLEEAQDAWGKLADSVVIATGTIIAHSMRAVSEIISGWRSAAAFIENAIKLGPGQAAMMADLAAQARVMATQLSEAQKEQIRFLVTAGETAENIGVLFGDAHVEANKYAVSLTKVGGAMRLTKDEAKALEDAAKKAAAAAKEHAQELDRAAAEGTRAYRLHAQAIENVDQQMKNLVRSMRPFVESGELARKVFDAGTASVIAYVAATVKGLKVTEGLGKELDNLGQKVDVFDLGAQQAAIMTRELEEQLTLIDNIASAFGRLGQQIGGAAGGALGGLGRMVSQIGDVRKAFGDLFDATAAGAGTLAKLGLTLGAIGTGTGIVVSAWKALVGLFEKMEFNAGNFARQTLRATGELREMNLQLRMAGVNAAQLFDIKGQKEFDRAFADAQRQIEATNRAMQEYGLTWRDFNNVTGDFVRGIASDLVADFQRLMKGGVDSEKALKGMSGALSQLVIDAVKTGQKIPAALKPILEQLIRMGQLTEEAAAAMLGLADDSIPSLDDIKAAAERYGLTLDQLGPKVAQLNINELAKQIVRDFETLSAAGADVGVIMNAMKDKVQDLVKQALLLGLSLPESLRKLIEEMIRAGILTDEFGNILTDTSRIDFATPLAERFDALMAKLQELIEVFVNMGNEAVHQFSRARNAAEAVGRAIPRGSNVPPAEGGTGTGTGGPPPSRGGGTPPPGGEPTPGDDEVGTQTGFAAAAAGLARVLQFPPRNAPAQLSPENVSRLLAFPAAASAGQSQQPQMMTIVIEKDGYREAEYITPYVIGEIKLKGMG